MNWLKAKWNALPEPWKKHIVSAVDTFVSTFLLSVAVQVGQHGFPSLRSDVLMSMGFVAIRAAWKVARTPEVQAPTPPVNQ